MDYLSRPQCNHPGPYERRPEGQTQRRDVTIEAQIGVMSFEDEGGAPPKNAGGLWKLEKTRKQIFHSNLQKEPAM